MKSLIIFLVVCFTFQSCGNQVDKNQKDSTKSKQKIYLKKNTKNEKSELEAEISKIIVAFENKDEKTINSYIDKNNGLYLIPGPGTLLHFEVLEKIDFAMSGIAYHNFGKQNPANYKFKYEEFPRYNCETFEWNKYGIFVATKYGSILNGIIENPQNKVEGKIYSEDEIRIVKNIDKITKSVISTTKDGDIDFGIAKIKGKYIITYLDIHESYCDI